MDRRTLIKLLLSSAVASTLDVEKMLWIPRTMITVPEMPVRHRWYMRDNFCDAVTGLFCWRYKEVKMKDLGPIDSIMLYDLFHVYDERIPRTIYIQRPTYAEFSRIAYDKA